MLYIDEPYLYEAVTTRMAKLKLETLEKEKSKSIYTIKIRARGVAQVVEHLSRKHDEFKSKYHAHPPHPPQELKEVPQAEGKKSTRSIERKKYQEC
jgi:hypothetical protein